MIVLHDGTTATEYAASTALLMEARRRGMSYGKLTADTDWWEQEEIILDYIRKKAAGARRAKPAT